MSESDLVIRAQETLGYEFNDPDILSLALTHASLADSRLESNERLEFLGDVILGVVVCETLFRQHEDWLEGDLTKVKSAVVSRRVCAAVSDEIGLADLLKLGKGVGLRSALPTSVRAAVYEAIIGAIYIDGGLEPARKFILGTLTPQIERCTASQEQENFKSALQQHVQRVMSATPHYETLDEQGPDHSKCFEICVVVAGERYPSAWGPSKKEAEQEAARRALEQLRSPKQPSSPQEMA